MKKWITNMAPWQRIVLALLFAGITSFVLVGLVDHHLPIIVAAMASFALLYNALSFVPLLSSDAEQTKELAGREDGTRGFMLIMISLSTLFSFGMVGALMGGKQVEATPAIIGLGLLGVVMSWTMIHTLFSFHYAYLYFKHGQGCQQGGGQNESEHSEKNESNEAEGKSDEKPCPLDFPGEDEPDYMDFVYYSFTIGCTFQVSDVAIQHKVLRRITLVHSVLSFFLNTFVVALGIEVLGGLGGK